MKKNFIFLFLLILLFLSSCKHTTVQTEVSVPTGTNGTGNTLMRLEIADDQMETYLRTTIKNDSSFILEGTVTNKSISYSKTGTTIAKYTFEDLEILAGRYEKDTFCLTVPQGDGYIPGVRDYLTGRRYIVIVYSPNNQFTPEEKVVYQNYGIFCQLDEENTEKIDKLVIEWKQTDIVKTKKALLKIIKEELGEPKDFYHPRDLYVHSDDITDIVDGAQIVAKVTVENVSYQNDQSYYCSCDCIPEEVYKGSLTDTKSGHFRLDVHPGKAENGQTYLIMCMKKGTVKTLNGQFPRYVVAAKENCVIPLSDTERVNEVYAALGIELEL